jgi:hypothetical protein
LLCRRIGFPFDVLHVRVNHHADEIVEVDFGRPVEFAAGLRDVAAERRAARWMFAIRAQVMARNRFPGTTFPVCFAIGVTLDGFKR